MVCATEVYRWFKELAAHSRIEFACSLLHLCIPSELRFISTLLEDMNNKDFPSLRDTEDSCNSPVEFSQYPHEELNSEHVHKLCISLSLLKPTNQNLAQMIYEILRIHFDFLSQSVMVNESFRNEILLLYALASHHPAFAFQCRHKLAEYFTTLLNIHDCKSSMSVNCNNSALKEQSTDLCQHKIEVSDVVIKKSDAIIIFEIVSMYGPKKFVTKRQCLYSKIKNTIETIFSPDNYFCRTMVFFSCNGNFTRENVSDIVKKILNFSGSESNQINLFFLHQPMIAPIDKEILCIEKCRSEDDTKVTDENSCPYVFQNDECHFDSSADSFSKQLIQQQIKTEKPASSVTNENKHNESSPTSSVDQCESSENLAVQDEVDQEPCESAYLEQVLVPINILGMPCPTFYQYCLPSYSMYGQSKSCAPPLYVLSPGNTPESVAVVDGSSKATLPYLADCHSQPFIYNLQQSQFRPLQFVSSFQTGTSSFLLSNVVSRPQSSTTIPTKSFIRHKASHHFPTSTS